MSAEVALTTSQVIVRVCLFLAGGIGIFGAGCGRLLSIRKVGLPEPRAVWLGYLVPELVMPWVMAVAHHVGE
ncbi:hypothetical protein [Piscinibacter terrae]|uniref:DUF4345 domain-containing protein n=1 Tax=Piscinibacter terrae TaxID=2496871 RepID=A0A3N7HU63_9BURK|nr:hypothetical protein [Albitalea terrae]RQP24451.1 hypothetical protein DZC73_14280 [Albitalea terrae]